MAAGPEGPDRGWVKRERRADDGRLLLVSLTEAGSATLEEFRAQVGAAMRVHMDAMSDGQIAALETATAALGSLVDTFPERYRDVNAPANPSACASARVGQIAHNKSGWRPTISAPGGSRSTSSTRSLRD